MGNCPTMQIAICANYSTLTIFREAPVTVSPQRGNAGYLTANNGAVG